MGLSLFVGSQKLSNFILDYFTAAGNLWLVGRKEKYFGNSMVQKGEGSQRLSNFKNHFTPAGKHFGKYKNILVFLNVSET